MRGRATSGRPAREPWPSSLVVLLVAVVTYGFQQTAITPALPVVQQDFGASRQWTAWLFSGYLIMASVTPVFLGKLADRSGKRRVFVAALVVFAAGSAGAALAPSIGVLVACRIVQGIGGVVFPLSFSIARDELPRKRLAAGIGLLSGGMGAGSIVGYVAGGLLAELASWRWIFGTGAIALAVAILLVRRAVPPSQTRHTRGLDTPGGVLFGAAMAALILAITEAPGRGWGSVAVLGSFAVCVLCIAGWVLRELRTPEPLLDLRVLKSRPVLLTNIAGVLGGYTLFGINLLVPFFVMDSAASGGSPLRLFGLAAGPILTAVILLPRALGQLVGSPLAGRLAGRFGGGRVLAASVALMALASGGLAIWRESIWSIGGSLAVMGLGFGGLISVSGTIMTTAVDPTDTGIATSMNSVLRRVGGGVGAQVAAALMASLTMAGSAQPSAEAFTVAFGVGFAVALVGAVCAAAVRPVREAS